MRLLRSITLRACFMVRYVPSRFSLKTSSNNFSSTEAIFVFGLMSTSTNKLSIRLYFALTDEEDFSRAFMSDRSKIKI